MSSNSTNDYVQLAQVRHAIDTDKDAQYKRRKVDCYFALQLHHIQTYVCKLWDVLKQLLKLI